LERRSSRQCSGSSSAVQSPKGVEKITSRPSVLILLAPAVRFQRVTPSSPNADSISALRGRLWGLNVWREMQSVRRGYLRFPIAL
jgi:hypothetical protein